MQLVSLMQSLTKGCILAPSSNFGSDFVTGYEYCLLCVSETIYSYVIHTVKWVIRNCLVIRDNFRGNYFIAYFYFVLKQSFDVTNIILYRTIF